jgi:hypothetical protein
MTTRHPPRLATWLLAKFGSARRNDSLLGDLHEQFAKGRSASWYWNQVARALVISIVQGVRTHAVSFATAAACACLLAWLWTQAHHFFIRHSLYVNGLMSSFTEGSDIAVLLTWSTSLLLKASFFFAAGWLAVRVHRLHPRTLMFVIVVMYFAFPLRIRSVVPPLDFSTQIVLSILSGAGCLLLGGLLSMHMNRRSNGKHMPA